MDALYAHAEAHHGVVSRREALALGLSNNQIDYRLRKGILRRAAPRVFILSGSPDSWHRRARIAALSLDGLVSHTAAAALHGIDGFGLRKIEISIGKDRRARGSRETVRRSTQLRFAEPVAIDALPVTGLTRTVLDLAGVLPYARFEWVVDAVLRQKLCEWHDLYEVLARHSIQGRNGCGPLRAILDARYGETNLPDSAFNRMVGKLLEDAGMPAVYEHEVRDEFGRFVGRVDLAYPSRRIAIELDSVRWHLNRESFERDPRRKNKLTLQGWTVLTFTWADYIDRPSELVRSVRSALEQAAA